MKGGLVWTSVFTRCLISSVLSEVMTYQKQATYRMEDLSFQFTILGIQFTVAWKAWQWEELPVVPGLELIIDQTGLQLAEISLPLLPECCD